MDFVCPSLSVNEQGNLSLGGADVPALARRYGTPVYLVDEDAVRKACRDYVDTMQEAYRGEYLICYASKALSFKTIYDLMRSERMGADVVSGGELYTALAGGMPADRIYFHGNNKQDEELRYALKSGVRRFVVDNREELYHLDAMAAEMGSTAEISFRIKPGVDAHTHEFIQTGKIDSKFGLALETGEAFDVIAEAAALPNIAVKGVHCHIGSQIFDAEPFQVTVRIMMELIKRVHVELGLLIVELNLGGGFGIRYIPSHDPRSVPDIVRATAQAVTQAAEALALPLPYLVLEPGRSIVGPAGITVYTVGSVKAIPGVRTYVSVDGGMTDNPRYALYGAAYEAVLPERPLAERTECVTIAGRCCESGDLVARDIDLPACEAGDLLAILATGAYNYSMASNYNRVPRPPVVLVSGETSRLAVRRETYEDLISCDL